MTNENLAGEPVTRTDQHLSLGKALDIPAISAEDFDPSNLPFGRPLSVRWTGFYTPQSAGDCEVIVEQAGFADSGYRLYIDDKLVRDSWNLTKAIVEDSEVSLDTSAHKVVLEYRSAGGFGGPFIRLGIVRRGTWTDSVAEEIARKAGVVVLAVGFDPTSESEGWDRTFRLPPGQDELIQKILGVNKRAIVVMTSGGGVDITRWVERVPGLIEAWYPGQEGGTALAGILFGDVHPSGRLPVTFERQWEDNPSHDHYYPVPGSNRIEYREGLFVGYRGFESAHIKPLFPFGFGLSYTTIKFTDLKVAPTESNPSGTPSDGHASVSRPPHELKGFAKVDLRPGETRVVTLPLDARSFSYFDVKAHQWRADAGTFKILVGSSSEQIELSTEVRLDRTIVSAP